MVTQNELIRFQFMKQDFRIVATLIHTYKRLIILSYFLIIKNGTF